VDYLSWSRSVKLEAIPLVVQHCRTVGPLSLSALNSHELQLLQNMLGRLCKVAQAAAEVRFCADDQACRKFSAEYTLLAAANWLFLSDRVRCVSDLASMVLLLSIGEHHTTDVLNLEWLLTMPSPAPTERRAGDDRRGALVLPAGDRPRGHGGAAAIQRPGAGRVQHVPVLSEGLQLQVRVAKIVFEQRLPDCKQIVVPCTPIPHGIRNPAWLAVSHLIAGGMQVFRPPSAAAANQRVRDRLRCLRRLAQDMERAQREGWCFGAKLVRGAYMFMERDRAKQCGYPSPVNDSIEATHANYNECALARPCVWGVLMPQQS